MGPACAGPEIELANVHGPAQGLAGWWTIGDPTGENRVSQGSAKHRGRPHADRDYSQPNAERRDTDRISSDRQKEPSRSRGCGTTTSPEMLGKSPAQSAPPLAASAGSVLRGKALEHPARGVRHGGRDVPRWSPARIEKLKGAGQYGESVRTRPADGSPHCCSGGSRGPRRCAAAAPATRTLSDVQLRLPDRRRSTVSRSLAASSCVAAVRSIARVSSYRRDGLPSPSRP